MRDYIDSYVNTLLAAVHQTVPFSGVRVIGEIDTDQARVPHSAVVFELEGAGFLSTTAGLAYRPSPFGTDEGFEYFELIAFSRGDSPGILWALSNIGGEMLTIAGGTLYATKDNLEWAASEGIVLEPKPLRPYETLRLGGDDSRFMMVPRWDLTVDRPVEVVELLPVAGALWGELEALDLDQRAERVPTLSLEERMAAWDPILAV